MEPYEFFLLPIMDAKAQVAAEALRAVPRPWFRYVEYESGDVLSEDLFFCEQAASAGVAIEADLRVRCGHSWRQTWWP